MHSQQKQGSQWFLGWLMSSSFLKEFYLEFFLKGNPQRQTKELVQGVGWKLHLCLGMDTKANALVVLDWHNVCTIQPSGVILVRAHGRVFPQCSENSRVRSHEVDVHACIQLSI